MFKSVHTSILRPFTQSWKLTFLRRYTSSNNGTISKSLASQRKKVLTFQKSEVSELDPNENINGTETIIHPAFVTSSNLETYLGQRVKPVVSVTKCESYDFDKVFLVLSLKGLAPVKIVPGECIKFNWNQNCVFIFKFGTIVAWNINEKEVINNILPIFKNSEITSYQYQSEDLDYIEINKDVDQVKDENFEKIINEQNEIGLQTSESYISKDTEIICLNVPNKSQKLLDMLAFSYGISRSTRLAILEEAVETHINLTRSTIEKLSHGEKIAVDPKETLKLSGRLLLLRGKLNLYSELVETPDIYWSESRLEKIHDKVSNALDISKRVNILNRKLDYLSEEADALVSIMSKRTEVNLELIIIYLIVIEVCFETYHFYERLGGKYNIEYFKALLN